MEVKSQTLIDFIKESNRIEGIYSAPCEIEIEAYEDFLSLKEITRKDIEKFVYIICGASIRLQKGMNVIVGSHRPILGGPRIADDLNNILIRINDFAMSPYEIHCAYEMLHPFMDCNGRSGRLIWLWMMEKQYLNGLGLPFLHRFYYQTLENSRI